MFVELKCKSNFSFLRGASDARDYVARAAELVMPAVGICDINGVYSLGRAWEVARNLPEIKLIVGSELTLSDHPNVTLIPRDRGAYAVMCKTITRLHAGKLKGEGALTLDELLESVGRDVRSSGLIALADLTTLSTLGPLKETFGDRLYVPLCRYLDGLDKERTQRTIEASDYYGIPIVATNEPHYHVPTRKLLHDTMVCIREGVTLKTGGKKLAKNAERYLKSLMQMKALFKDLPKSIKTTIDIAESCTFKPSELQYTYPNELIPAGHTSQSYLEELVFQGTHRVYRGVIPQKVDERLRKELKLIAAKGYANYFLTIADIVSFARGQGILCQGRGSAANSMVCYVLEVTAINAVDANLLFERFISSGRNEPPDIDVDFEHERREEIIQYIYRRFGRDRAAMVSAVRTYQNKSAFLEVSKAFGVPVGVVSANVLARDFDQIAGDLRHKRDVIQDLADDLTDFPRHLSIHSGGFTLSDGPLDEIIPIEPARMEGRTIVQADKHDIETLLLLKLDILAIGFLTVTSKATKMLAISPRDIPPDDQKTYDLICAAKTIGTFQIESRAQIAMLPRTKPRSHFDLVVEVSIVRPGPGSAGMVQPYLDRRARARQGIKHNLPHPGLEPILGSTYGLPMFQESVMDLAIQFAGFSDIEADELRRSISKERSAKSVDAIGEKLKAGLMKSGLPRGWIEETCNYFKGFSAYNFPLSHAESYALIAYWSAYLKAHHPGELLCALINSQPLGFYSLETLINDAKRTGNVKVLPINPNLSSWDAVMEGPNTVRMGFRNVRRIREEDVKWMTDKNERELKESDIRTKISEDELKNSFKVLEAERLNAPFSSLFDFMKRTRFSEQVVQAMAMADVFHCFGQDRRHSFWDSMGYHSFFEKANSAQLSLFTEVPNAARKVLIFKPMTLVETITADYEALGYSITGHIMLAFRKAMPWLPPHTSASARKLQNGNSINYAGVLSTFQRPPTAKGVAFLTLEDNEGSVDLIVKKEVFEKFSEIIKNNRFLQIFGKVQRKGDQFSVLIENARSFIAEENPKSVSHGATSRTFGTPIYSVH